MSSRLREFLTSQMQQLMRTVGTNIQGKLAGEHVAHGSSLEAVCEVHQALPCLEACLAVQGLRPEEHVKHCTCELPAAPGAGMMRHPIPQVARSDHCTAHSISSGILKTCLLDLQCHPAQSAAIALHELAWLETSRLKITEE